MLVAQSDFRALADKRGKDDRHLYGLSGVQVEAVHCDVVERLDLEPRLFAQLPDCRALRAFSCVDLAINELPLAGPARIWRTLEHEYPPITGVVANDIDFDDSRNDLRHEALHSSLVDDGLR